MKKSRFFIAASCFLLSLSFLSGQEKITLTIDQAVEYALENSKSLKSAAIDLEVKKRADFYSWNTLLPSASLSGTLARSNNIDSIKSQMDTSAVIMGMVMNPSWNAAQAYANKDKIIDGMIKDEEATYWHPVGNLSFQWNFNLAMIGSMIVSRKQYEAGKISWEKSCNDTELQIRQLFYSILLMQESLKIDEESLANSEARMKQAEINYRNGQVPELSLLNARVTYQNKKPSVEWSRQQVSQQLDLFAFLLGLPYGQKIELNGSIDDEYEKFHSNLVELDASELYSKHIDNNPEVQTLRKTISVLKSGITAASFKTFTPSLSVGWGFQPTVTDIKKDWFDDSNYTDGGNLTITLVYTNLFDMLPFSANMQKIKDTKQDLAKAELGLEQLYQNTEMKINNSVADINKSLDNIASMNRNIEVAQSAYNSTLRGYNNGSQEELAVKDAENSLKQAKLGLMNEKLTFITTVMKLENELNTKLVK
ncbi:MAG: TolC family protein [Treponema sp.]|nr:TolC family protein [Treponema sp.]